MCEKCDKKLEIVQELAADFNELANKAKSKGFDAVGDIVDILVKGLISTVAVQAAKGEKPTIDAVAKATREVAESAVFFYARATVAAEKPEKVKEKNSIGFRIDSDYGDMLKGVKES